MKTPANHPTALVLAFAGALSMVYPAQAEEAVVKREGNVAFVEGPVWLEDGNVLFTDIQNNRIDPRHRESW